MLGKTFSVMVLISVICACFTGNVDELGTALMTATTDAVSIMISLVGMMCFWNGIMNVVEKTSLQKCMLKLLEPVLRVVFSKRIMKNDSSKHICNSFIANMLGLGNAALPLSLRAINSLKADGETRANDDIIMFAVLGTVPFQLVPTTLISLRNNYGSKNSFDIIVPIWICSVTTIILAVVICKFFAWVGRKYDS